MGFFYRGGGGGGGEGVKTGRGGKRGKRKIAWKTKE